MLVFGAFRAAAAQQPRSEGSPGRVVVVSLDGLAHHLWEDDVAAHELRALRRIARQGVVADGLIQSFPSITPSGHAALWTGAYGRISGIVAAQNPVLPRSRHTAFERQSGFDSRALRAEPIWVTAAEGGVRVVAHQATQTYPFIPRVTAPGAPVPPVLITGYGPAMLAPHATIDLDDVSATDSQAWGDALPASSLPPRTFEWRVGQVTFHGALVADGAAPEGYTALHVAAEPGGPTVRVVPTPTETQPPRGRALARYFSEGLVLTVGRGRPHTVAYFRLYDLAPDGSSFLLYQPSLHELAMHAGPASEEDAERVLLEAGGFIGNGPSYLYRDGEFGPQVYHGGDGTAERRYLEGVELVIRQYNRLSRWLVARHEPDLLLDYSNYPDEIDHWWYGLVRPDVTGVDERIKQVFDGYRIWAYAALDRRVALLDSIAGPDGHILVTSDHGMSPVAKEVRVNVALRNAGLLRLDEDGRIDGDRTQAVLLKYCVLANTEDWKGGIVPAEGREPLLGSIRDALAQVADPETGAAIFTGFYRPESMGDSLGIGGPAGCDLYFELAPGYAASPELTGEVVVETPVPYGYHGFLSTRAEMLSGFIGRGPRIPKNSTMSTIRAIDVAPTVSDLLGIRPPRDSRGRSFLPLIPKDGGER